MRAVISRVDGAYVEVAPFEGPESVVGRVDGPGLLALIGVARTDDLAAAHRLAMKIAGLRILAGDRSVLEAGATVLVVSQFTLYGDTRRGRRPTWAAAAPGPVAEPLVAAVVQGLRDAGVDVQTGVFGADMRVHSVNDGPFTVLVEVATGPPDPGGPGRGARVG